MSGRGALVPLRPCHVETLALPESVEANAVRMGLARLVGQAEPWSWAALLEVAPSDVRVAGAGGFMWLGDHHCWAALCPAAWVRPMQWRPFIRPIFERLDLAHRAGARLIETDVYGPFAAGHRLAMALGFRFERVKRGHDGGQALWLTYARHRDVPKLPPKVERYRRGQHIEILRALCPDLVGPATAADLNHEAPLEWRAPSEEAA